MRSHALLTLALAAAPLAPAGCAPPPEADYPVSEQAQAAPPPFLVPTENFATPLAEGAAAIERIGPERDALAARAAALRDRGAALSAADVVDAPGRDRLEAAGTQAPAP